MHQKEHNLITSCKKGHQKAQMQLYDQYCDAMFTIACRYLNSEEDAKDLMQDAFLKAFTNIKNYQPDATFGAWLKRIVINQCLDFLRKRKLEFTNDEVETLQLIDEDNWNFNNTITKSEILKAIENLTEKHKVVVKLYLIEGYDHQEISQILEIPEKTSRTHLRRGKQKLQELLKQKYNEARH